MCRASDNVILRESICCGEKGGEKPALRVTIESPSFAMRVTEGLPLISKCRTWATFRGKYENLTEQ
jgi:hypothetical protein